jgi:hypothetical protein
MPFVVLYVENADLIATFETLKEAQEALTRFVRDHPDVRDQAAVLEVDPSGHGVGQYVYADQHIELLA